MDYRNAVKEDLVDLIALVQEFCEESNIPYEFSRITNYVMSQLDSIHCVVATEDDIVRGVISFVVMPTPFSTKEIIARKVTFYVSKDYRGYGIGSILIHKAEQLAKENNATKFFLSSPLPIKDYDVFEVDYNKGI